MFKLAHSLHGLTVALVLTCGLASPSLNARAATAEPLDVDPEVLAKLAMEKARATSRSGQTQSAAKKEQQNNAPGAECGAIAIGNVIGNNRIGFAPTDVNVVIVGDVINANNNCK
jgi:hypothetical protein